MVKIYVEAKISFELNPNTINPDNSLEVSWLLDTLSRNMEIFDSDIGDFLSSGNVHVSGLGVYSKEFLGGTSK